jgi:hypothetical protein
MRKAYKEAMAKRYGKKNLLLTGLLRDRLKDRSSWCGKRSVLKEVG